MSLNEGREASAMDFWEYINMWKTVRLDRL